MAKKKTGKKIKDLNDESVKPLRIRFCPECKSGEVYFVFRLQNIFGLLPRIECTNCGHHDVDFPVLILHPDELKKKKKKPLLKKVTKKKKVKKVRKKK